MAFAHLGSLKRALGDLDRVTGWLRVFALVNAAPVVNQTPRVSNGYSDLILKLYDPEIGLHALVDRHDAAAERAGELRGRGRDRWHAVRPIASAR